ncbi:Crp/Fnr family transcriptional regulator [Spirosoma montaniterrae]|uniref:Cyclic nucleotide-binding protein n=1 Tax=Spirosoma montaniterrae TaxID=1178516 RepID=A0A1P9WVW5_9BACT|nr:Crp/Fnr family transcriptional regulator [Spirosoma montaniterrae]AQG79522.1 cyclic nucleotide-binding protein [Spirosoma montaniterrae]
MTTDILTDYLITQSPKACLRKRLERGDYIYKPGDDAPYVYLLEKGVVKIGSLGPLGERVVYDVLRPGEVFGDLDYLDEVEFFEFAQAATSLSIVVVQLSFFRHIIIHDPVVAEWFNETIVRRWYKAEMRLLHRAHETVENRLYRLKEQHIQVVKDADGLAHQVLQLLSHQEIADLVGATRQTVSKKLRRMPV